MQSYQKHGATKTVEYRIWRGIKARCLYPNVKCYPRYGGAGITISPLWVNDFLAFLAEIGPRPTPDHSVDRIDATKGYEPGNVRWATRVEQANNKPNQNVRLTYRGKTRTMSEWARHVGLSVQTLAQRRARGMSISQILSRKPLPAGSAGRGRSTKVRHQGRSQTLEAWAKEAGIDGGTLRNRLRRGWSMERALSEPPKQMRR